MNCGVTFFIIYFYNLEDALRKYLVNLRACPPPPRPSRPLLPNFAFPCGLHTHPAYSVRPLILLFFFFGCP